MAQEDKVTRSDVLDALASITLRAEKRSSDEDLLENFVPIVSFEALSTPNTQIVYGRNGTGKTHLLRAFSEHCVRSFESTKLLPIYIDCRNLELGPVMPSVELHDLLLTFYRRLFIPILDRLREYSDKVIDPNVLERLFGSEAADRRRSIQSSFEALHKLLNEQVLEEQLQEYVRKIEREKVGSSTLSGGVGLSAKASEKAVSAGFTSKMEAATERSAKEREKVELVFKGLSVVD